MAIGIFLYTNEAYGAEWYAEQITKHKRGSTYGAP